MRLIVKATDIARRVDRVPGLMAGLALIVVGALMVPSDPHLEEVWDRVEGVVNPEGLAGALTRSGNPLANVILLVLILLLASRHHRAKLAWASAVAGVATTFAVEVLKHLVGRGRPSSVGEVNAFLPFSPESGWHSFPSGHAGNIAVLAIFLAMAFPRLRKPALVWAIAVGVARVTLGRHFFGDIVAGWGVGVALSGVILWRFRLLSSGDRLLLGSMSAGRRMLAFGAVALLLMAMPGEHTPEVGCAVLVLAALLQAWATCRHSRGQPWLCKGPWALVRHPCRLAGVLVVAGLSVMANWWLVSVVAIGLAVALSIAAIAREEDALLAADEADGGAYAGYMKRVPALIPTIRSLRAAFSRGEWRWSGILARASLQVFSIAVIAYLLMEGKQEVFETVARVRFVSTFGLPLW